MWSLPKWICTGTPRGSIQRAPKLHRPHMQELKADPNQPCIDRMIADFGPVDSYHESGSYQEVRSRTNVPLISIPNMPGSFYVRPTRPVIELSSLRASANSFMRGSGNRSTGFNSDSKDT